MTHDCIKCTNKNISFLLFICYVESVMETIKEFQRASIYHMSGHRHVKAL